MCCCFQHNGQFADDLLFDVDDFSEAGHEQHDHGEHEDGVEIEEGGAEQRLPMLIAGDALCVLVFGDVHMGCFRGDFSPALCHARVCVKAPAVAGLKWEIMRGIAPRAGATAIVANRASVSRLGWWCVGVRLCVAVSIYGR